MGLRGETHERAREVQDAAVGPGHRHRPPAIQPSVGRPRRGPGRQVAGQQDPPRHLAQVPRLRVRRGNRHTRVHIPV